MKSGERPFYHIMAKPATFVWLCSPLPFSQIDVLLLF